ncbi:hypothetical protein A3D77_05905 [Candidatus Gottesmanbacteria bacterium RIFCSPHIGHO2_02_FULL_39_11]|uniref:Uncharacterized protein n=1 Tax=Candidatus Gottesmanbacteria bacterium RIFCSPHIGHO2_02_FULL_39_11 TaxID=1798382 RepID=A0A1F5ZSX9_9BACT|nr:MAG: hypothetical protein A3D77_05905 [Candidatus Gottesmanbacteria bacterium RIFCSPHIGHO2_02_FULL_39_11]
MKIENTSHSQGLQRLREKVAQKSRTLGNRIALNAAYLEDQIGPGKDTLFASGGLLAGAILIPPAIHAPAPIQEEPNSDLNGDIIFFGGLAGSLALFLALQIRKGHRSTPASGNQNTVDQSLNKRHESRTVTLTRGTLMKDTWKIEVLYNGAYGWYIEHGKTERIARENLLRNLRSGPYPTPNLGEPTVVGIENATSEDCDAYYKGNRMVENDWHSKQ